ncbi:MCM family protein [Heterostelium album PN500]|uniref:DNA replication licensing factor MCM6 n=1 Tax=Heterostelium pallidum (strain ATCC 26659 / Pp 5 / PN500) TaxID=670386 RepID=D3BV25_HETP5|nr:MCM family protein [Heterostelium album PN500]EFA74963.1 MCM family protein [Heterostelium album PN500]|eukprot:XP_020427097.1 MCM family protein [Heterostelium album PN500]
MDQDAINEVAIISKEVCNRFIKFLTSFVVLATNGHISNNNNDDSDNEDEEENLRASNEPLYINRICEMIEKGKRHINVDITHLESFDDYLSKTIREEYIRYEKEINSALVMVSRRYEHLYIDKDSNGGGGANVNANGAKQEQENADPVYQVCFYNIQEIIKIRDLRTARVGTLCAITGTVTRTTEVRPELLIGSFICMDCRNQSVKIPQEFKYTEPTNCLTPGCSNTRRWNICMDTSIFVDWQKVRIQENSNDIPSGSMPRSLDIVLRGDAVESARAGDKVVFYGTPMVIPDVSRMNIGQNSTLIKGIPNTTNDSASKSEDFGGVSGIKDLGVREMSYKVCFLANCVRSIDANPHAINVKDDNTENDFEETPETFLASLPKAERKALESMLKKKNMYKKLVDSIAPSIFGHAEIKRGVLLMLFGGVHKQTPEKIRLRGDINVCIVGDPSTSKSQFLKYLISFLPRTVYTSGKASSAAGLTATVVRDPDSGDFNIEAGALMLADNGICCIDEFDKMDPADQVAIHEAMEQQTISIAKAGIHATLNARASILAAANPIGGRYDKTKSLKHNLSIGAALISRFDLFFIVTDQANPEQDKQIAQHIVAVHQRKQGLTQEFSLTEIKNYIGYAKLIKPVITTESADLLEYYYSKLRQDVSLSGTGNVAYRITVRQLESLVRLSESYAKLCLSDQVLPKHVHEAARLLMKSVVHVRTDDIKLAIDEDENNQDWSIDNDAFHATCNLIVLYLRKFQEGKLQKDILDWYMSNSDTEDQSRELLIVRAVLKQMIVEKKLLIVKESKTEDERLLIVHPNHLE